jgi:hypothetical protein
MSYLTYQIYIFFCPKFVLAELLKRSNILRICSSMSSEDSNHISPKSFMEREPPQNISSPCTRQMRSSQRLLRMPAPMDQITTKTPNPKGRLFWKIDLLRDFAAGVYLSPPPLLDFCFGVVKQFCRFGNWSNAKCIAPVDALHTTWSHPPSPSGRHCINTYLCTYSHREGGGGRWTSEGR